MAVVRRQRKMSVERWASEFDLSFEQKLEFDIHSFS